MNKHFYLKFRFVFTVGKVTFMALLNNTRKCIPLHCFRRDNFTLYHTMTVNVVIMFVLINQI